MDHFISDSLKNYIEEHSSKHNEVLNDLYRETHLNVLIPQMISGSMQGRFLSMMSHMLSPKKILEVGTYTGYSAICLSEGLAEGGVIHSIEINKELEDIQQRHFHRAGCSDKIQVRFGSALDIIPQLEDGFDLAFIDADKKNYPNYYQAILPKMRKNGIILADNVLWSGRVLEDEVDANTAAIKEFNRTVQEDTRVTNFILPLRDGIMMIRKL